MLVCPFQSMSLYDQLFSNYTQIISYILMEVHRMAPV